MHSDINNENKDPSPFGQQGTPYFPIDGKLIALAPILGHDLTRQQLVVSLETLESDGPFEPSFLTYMVMVYNVLHFRWGKTGWWSHMKKFSNSNKNGLQVYRTLHAVLLGGHQVVSTGNAIIAKLQSFRYEGHHKNFNFNKYLDLYVEQHNQEADLQEYSVAPLAENLKTLWFHDGIKCNLLDAVKASINTNCANFTDFDSVKDTYVEFKHMLGPINDPKTHQITPVSCSGRRGGCHSCQPGCGQGQQTNDNCQKGLVPQAEVDKQTYITLRYYSKDEFEQLTPAAKQKLWQLKNPCKTPMTGLTRHDRERSTSVASTPTVFSDSAKCQVEEPIVKDNQPSKDLEWGRRRNGDHPPWAISPSPQQ